MCVCVLSFVFLFLLFDGCCVHSTTSLKFFFLTCFFSSVVAVLNLFNWIQACAHKDTLWVKHERWPFGDLLRSEKWQTARLCASENSRSGRNFCVCVLVFMLNFVRHMWMHWTALSENERFDEIVGRVFFFQFSHVPVVHLGWMKMVRSLHEWQMLWNQLHWNIQQ